MTALEREVIVKDSSAISFIFLYIEKVMILENRMSYLFVHTYVCTETVRFLRRPPTGSTNFIGVLAAQVCKTPASIMFSYLAGRHVSCL